MKILSKFHFAACEKSFLCCFVLYLNWIGLAKGVRCRLLLNELEGRYSKKSFLFWICAWRFAFRADSQLPSTLCHKRETCNAPDHPHVIRYLIKALPLRFKRAFSHPSCSAFKFQYPNRCMCEFGTKKNTKIAVDIFQ